MSAFPRYALYYVPARDSALGRFGAETLGYDAFSGDDVPFAPDYLGAYADWSELTRDPRTYGFHATLKAPFALSDGVDEADLIAACAAFCAEPRDIPLIEPVVATISGFTAIIPKETRPELLTLAREIVERFDRLRAPLSEADRARRNPAKLTPRQIEYLDRWGYPYVMDEFRFHMTLTGRLPPERAGGILGLLGDRFAQTGINSIAADRLGLFCQPAAGARFRILSEYPLR